MSSKQRLAVIIGIIAVIIPFVVVGLLVTARGQEGKMQEHLDLGAQYLDELDYERAIAEYTAVLSIDPKCVDAYLGIVDAYVGMGDYENALLKAQEGYDKTGDERLVQKVEEVKSLMEPVSTATPVPIVAPTPKPSERLTPIETEVPIATLIPIEELIITIPLSYELVASLGSVRITKKSNDTSYYGAMDYDGNEMVPNIYDKWYAGPNEEGFFSLGYYEWIESLGGSRTIRHNEDTAYFFDKQGLVKLTVEHLGKVVLYEDKVLYDTWYIDNETYYGGITLFDLSSETILYHDEKTIPLSVIGEKIAYEAEYYPIMQDDGEFYYKDGSEDVLYKIIVDESGSSRAELVESISKENIDTFVYGTYNEGYASRINYNNDNELQIISKDGIESYSFHIEELLQAWYLTEAAYTDNGSLKCYADIEMLSSLSMNNKGKLITICHTDWQSEQTCTHLLDMSYVSYDENGKIQNPEEVILATYEDITLSNSQYHIARNKGENAYYIDGIGRVIKEAYQSCTDFRNGYAMMIDPKGYVYIIDENFSQVAGGHSHSWGTHEVFRIGDAFCVDDGFQKIYLASPKK